MREWLPRRKPIRRGKKIASPSPENIARKVYLGVEVRVMDRLFCDDCYVGSVGGCFIRVF